MNTDVYYFMENLVRLIDGGCTIRESLELLATEQRNSACSNIAKKIIVKIGRGESLSDAFDSTAILPGAEFFPYRQQLDRTGDIKGTLSLVLTGMRRKQKLKENLVRSLLYPAFLFMLMSTCTALLLIIGIPWLKDSGFITSTETIARMYDGTRTMVITLAVSVSALAAAVFVPLRRKKLIASYWEILSSLAACGIPFETCSAACSEPARSRDTYTIMTLRSAELTGNFEEAFKSIANHHAGNLDSGYETVARLAEPVLLLIVGVAIAIVSVTVFLPLFNFSGGFA